MSDDDLQQRTYPEDERLRQVQEEPDRRMTHAEWEREESLARQAAHKKHEQAKHDRKVQQEFDKKKRGQNRNWKKIFLWVGGGVLVLLLVFLIGFVPRHERAKKTKALAKQREQEQPQVDVMQVKRSRAPGALTVPGTTTSFIEAFIYARANGYIRKRFVDIGDHVKKGQMLALIDAPDLDQQVDQGREQVSQAEAQLAQQQAQLSLNRVTWERYRILVAKGVFSRQDGDQQESAYYAQIAFVDSMRRNVESYRANLRRLIALQVFERVTAPFDGVITQRNTNIGALVGQTGAAGSAPMNSPQMPTGGSASSSSSNTSGSSGMVNQAATPSTAQAQGGPIFAIASFKTLRILVSVPEGYASDIRTGMPVQVFLQERQGKPIAGTVTRTANAIDQNTRTMLVEVDVDNRDGSLYPGMYAVVSFIQVHGTSPITVPGDAIVIRQDRSMVAIVRDQKIQLVPIEIGRDYGPAVEILRGLQVGDWVVTTVTDNVRPGVKVRPRQNQEANVASGQNSSQTSNVPDTGPAQYGDQSIVNSKTESTNQRGKPGQDKKGGSSNQSGGKQPKQSKKNGSGQ